MTIENTLPRPQGTYKTTAVAGELIFVSNMDSERPGSPNITGRIGETVSMESALQAAERCAENIYDAAVSALPSGNIISAIVLLRCAVLGTDEFADHMRLAHHCLHHLQSQTKVAHETAVVAYGATSLPGGSTIEVEAVLRMTDGD